MGISTRAPTRTANILKLYLYDFFGSDGPAVVEETTIEEAGARPESISKENVLEVGVVCVFGKRGELNAEVMELGTCATVLSVEEVILVKLLITLPDYGIEEGLGILILLEVVHGSVVTIASALVVTTLSYPDTVIKEPVHGLVSVVI